MPFECVSMRVWGCTALLLAGLMCVPEARAWEAVTDGLPDQAVVAVDKSRQRFFLMEKGKSRDYLCTTGQAQGDKQVRGDLKTPEGVYFVVRKRTERLDFEEYGGEAYILDYPNPVDRLRGKTGSGIWVHSRGRAITPFESRGCVVLNLKDIAEVGPELKRGHPCLSANGWKSRPGRTPYAKWRNAPVAGARLGAVARPGTGSLRRNVPHP